jgi:hypothetical protein
MSAYCADVAVTVKILEARLILNAVAVVLTKGV